MKWNRACGRWAVPLSMAALLLLLDRLSKAWALTRLRGTGGLKGLDGVFSFRFAWNEGAAFSLLASSPALVAALSGALLILLGAVILWGRTLSVPMRLSLTAVWAGGAGNLIDRLLYGAVVDFIRLDFMSFPIFNGADICVTLGAICLAAHILITDRKGRVRS